jgi:hypothetical protein
MSRATHRSNGTRPSSANFRSAQPPSCLALIRACSIFSHWLTAPLRTGTMSWRKGKRCRRLLQSTGGRRVCRWAMREGSECYYYIMWIQSLRRNEARTTPDSVAQITAILSCPCVACWLGLSGSIPVVIRRGCRSLCSRVPSDRISRWLERLSCVRSKGVITACFRAACCSGILVVSATSNVFSLHAILQFPETAAFAGATLQVPSCFMAGDCDVGVVQRPGALRCDTY